MKRRLSSIIFALFMTSGFAQGRTLPYDPIRRPVEPPRIVMKVPEADEDSIRLASLDVDVSVAGNVATTTCDMIFTNSSSRVLEGEFEFPLGQGQTVVGYALDINGRMRQGVAVEKEKGRTVFEDVVRRNVDPGLVEMTEGNNFKTRVYPLPAGGSRHIQVTYEEIIDSSENRSYILQPLTDAVLDSFTFEITVYGQDSYMPPKPQESGGVFSLFAAEDVKSGYHSEISKRSFSFINPIMVNLPNDSGAGQVFTQDVGRDTYFYFYTPMTSSAKAKNLPSSLTVYYDVSSSMANRNFNVEMQLLRDYISRLRNPSVTVVPFSNALHEARTFNSGWNSSNIAGEIESFLRSQVYDGATNLNIDFARLYSADEILVFTDGISNWNENADSQKNHAYYGRPAVINTINSCSSANHGTLQSIAQKNGGVYIDLSSQTEASALESLLNESIRLIRADYDRNSISDLVPEEGETITGDFSMAGILRRKNALVTLSFGYGNTVTETRTVQVSAFDGNQNGPRNISRLWAQKKIAELSKNYDINKDEIISIAKKFTVVTKDTSLIVLDSADDYAKYGIEPPEDLRAEYDRIVRNQRQTKPTSDYYGISDSVYKNFEAFKKWWNTNPDDFKTKNPATPRASGGGRGGYRLMSEAVEAPQFDMIMEESAASAPQSMARSTRTQAAVQVQEFSGQNSVQSKMSADGNSYYYSKSPAISIQAWNPNATYLQTLKRTPVQFMYSKYIELKKNYESSPSFYMDAADYFMDENLADEAKRILSNLAEMNLENSDVLRALGNKLIEWGLYKDAVPVFEKLVKIRSEIPQFYRDLALAYYHSGDAQKAVDTLYAIVCKKWDSRFEEIQQIALNDMNAIISAERRIDTSRIDRNLLQNFPVDIRVVLTWNTDNCDIDLWVTDPNGEKCYYGHKLTQIGGRISRDFTQGYGPEEFCIKQAVHGKYKIEANYYGTSSQKILQPVVVQAEVYTNFGTPWQKKQVLTLQLEKIKGSFTVGEVTF
ncbi:MAG TPA: hypothetical protein DEO40_02235 [Treponema sp.]|nr:hypothetical protein [Treponema sp.]